MAPFWLIEAAQQQISSEINQAYLGKKVPVLFEQKSKNRWYGRTPSNKLVFAESDQNLLGQMRDVTITWTGPWSLIADL